MNRRVLPVIVLGALVTLCAVLAFTLLPRESPIHPARFAEIPVGMARTEVEHMLGGPPRNECTGSVFIWVPRADGRKSAELDTGPPKLRFFPAAKGVEANEAVWVSEAGLLAVRFGADGRVREKYTSDVIVVDTPWRNPPAAIARWFQR
jgi:hypothetical protein